MVYVAMDSQCNVKQPHRAWLLSPTGQMSPMHRALPACGLSSAPGFFATFTGALAWAGITKYHSLSGLTDRNWISQPSEGWKPEIRVPARLCSARALLLACRWSLMSPPGFPLMHVFEENDQWPLSLSLSPLSPSPSISPPFFSHLIRS